MPDSFLRPASPPSYTRAANSPYFQIALYAGGNVLAVGICLLLWFCWDVLSAFEEPLLWAWLCSLSLRDIKRYLVTTARRELRTSSFVVCVAKLVFLPVVILWQLFEEVRDQLQAKYQELQQKTTHSQSQATAGQQPDNAADPADTAEDSTADSPVPNGTEAAVEQQETTAAAAAAAQAEAPAGNILLKQPQKQQQQQQLRQRKAASNKQQQQQQRLPSGPTRAAAAAAQSVDGRRRPTGAQRGPRLRQHSNLSSNSTTVAAAQKTAAGAVAATAVKRSKLQRRLRRWRYIALKQLRWWWFCITELVKYLLRGLLPQQQQQQQQQGQQRFSCTDTSAVSTPMRGSLTDSFSSNCAPQWGNPWSPPQGWQQHQQQQQLLHMLQQHRGLSSSYSSPALNLEAAHSFQPYSAAAAAVHSPGVHGVPWNLLVAAAPAAAMSPAHAVGDHASASWAPQHHHQQQQQQQLQQQQQQQRHMTRCESSSSGNSTASQAIRPAQSTPVVGLPAAAAAAGSRSSTPPPAAAAGAAARISSSSELSSRTHSSVLAYNRISTPPPLLPAALGFNTTSSLAAPGFSPMTSLGLNPSLLDPFSNTYELNPSARSSDHQGLHDVTQLPLAGSMFSVAGCDGHPAAAAAAAAPRSVVMAGGGSPSSVLFKWLLRGIVLYEGYRCAQSFLAGAEPLFVLLLLVGGSLALAGGLPFLLLPGTLWRSLTLNDKDPEIFSPDKPQQQRGKQQQQQQQRKLRSSITSPFQQQQDAVAPPWESSSGWYSRACAAAAAGWGRVVEILIRADTWIRSFCASSFLDTAVSGLIVIGLILGSVVLSVILVVQVGEESRQAVVHLNTLMRNKGTEAALRQGVKSLLQDEYVAMLEGQVTSMLKDSLPSLTQYVESRASDFLVSHNLSKVLLDVENVKAALKLPGDCSEEARMKLAVQLANSSLAIQNLGQQRSDLQQQIGLDRALLGDLARQYEKIQIATDALLQNVTADRTDQDPAYRDGNSSSGSGSVAQQLVEVQGRLSEVEEQQQGITTHYEAAQEQLQLAQLRLHNCQPAAAAADTEAATASRSILSTIWPASSGGAGAGATPAAAVAAAAAAGVVTIPSAGVLSGSSSSNTFAQVSSRVLHAVLHWDFTAAGREAAAFLGHLYPEDQQQQQQQQFVFPGLTSADGEMCDLVTPNTCTITNSSSSSNSIGPTAVIISKNSSSTDSTATTAAAAAAASSTGATHSIIRVAQGAAYPLITPLRQLGSVFLTGIGSTTAVALGTGLGVLRLGLGVVKFLVQLGVFASVLYTLLALDIDPVEQLLRLLPMSEASQDRASRAVTQAMRGVFVSSLKLAAFHAGFTWLTLRAFGTHFVTLASAASAVVAVLPLVPVALVALPGVLELVLLRGAPVKGVVLAALHFGAYSFGDDLIYREVEPTLPYLVGLGVFGGMYTFRNPLHGVVLGPMMLALLSVGYNLHRDMY